MESVGINSSQDLLDLVESQMDSNTIYYLNSRLGIWLYNQSRIDLNPQSNLYDVLTLDNTILCPTHLPKKITATRSAFRFTTLPVDNSILKDEEVVWEVRRLCRNRARGASGMKAEHLCSWMQAETREESTDPSH